MEEGFNFRESKVARGLVKDVRDEALPVGVTPGEEVMEPPCVARPGSGLLKVDHIEVDFSTSGFRHEASIHTLRVLLGQPDEAELQIQGRAVGGRTGTLVLAILVHPRGLEHVRELDTQDEGRPGDGWMDVRQTQSPEIGRLRENRSNLCAKASMGRPQSSVSINVVKKNLNLESGEETLQALRWLGRRVDAGSARSDLVGLSHSPCTCTHLCTTAVVTPAAPTRFVQLNRGLCQGPDRRTD